MIHFKYMPNIAQPFPSSLRKWDHSLMLLNTLRSRHCSSDKVGSEKARPCYKMGTAVMWQRLSKCGHQCVRELKQPKLRSGCAFEHTLKALQTTLISGLVGDRKVHGACSKNITINHRFGILRFMMDKHLEDWKNIYKLNA